MSTMLQEELSVCPICLATGAAMLAASATTTGGLVAIVLTVTGLGARAPTATRRSKEIGTMSNIADHRIVSHE